MIGAICGVIAGAIALVMLFVAWGAIDQLAAAKVTATFWQQRCADVIDIDKAFRQALALHIGEAIAAVEKCDADLMVKALHRVMDAAMVGHGAEVKAS